MSTTTILSQDQLDRAASRIADELSDLATEIFVSEYGVDWHTAIDRALETFPDLLDYADSLTAGEFTLWPASMPRC